MDISFLNNGTIITFIGVFISAAAGTLGACLWLSARDQRQRDEALLTSANVTIAWLVAVLGRLINLKKDHIQPAQAESETATTARQLSVWPVMPASLALPAPDLFAHAGRQLDVIQLLKLLEFNLAELSHQITTRNDVINRCFATAGADSPLPLPLLHLYLSTLEETARLTDENLFFIDKAIHRLRQMAVKSLPKTLHPRIADVGLRPDAGDLMPPADLIKTFA